MVVILHGAVLISSQLFNECAIGLAFGSVCVEHLHSCAAIHWCRAGFPDAAVSGHASAPFWSTVAHAVLTVAHAIQIFGAAIQP